MKERPILMSAPMVRAILEGRKMQTRRVVKPQPYTTTTAFRDIPDTPFFYGAISTKNDFWEEFYPDPAHGCWRWKCPYGVPGDRLIVKEATWLWCERRPNGTTKTGRPKWHFIWQENTPPVYVADHPQKPVDDIPVTNSRGNRLMWKYKSARFMPKKASRITLEVTDVRPGRLQEISEADAMAEGVTDAAGGPIGPDYMPRLAFRHLWNKINAKRGFGWDVNPWVWAITFRRGAA